MYHAVCELLGYIHLQCYFSVVALRIDVCVSFTGSSLLHECKFIIWCFLIWAGDARFRMRLVIVYMFLIAIVQ